MYFLGRALVDLSITNLTLFVSAHGWWWDLCCLYRPYCSDVLQRSQTLLFVWFCWAALWTFKYFFHRVNQPAHVLFLFQPTPDQTEEMCSGESVGEATEKPNSPLGLRVPLFRLNLHVKEGLQTTCTCQMVALVHWGKDKAKNTLSVVKFKVLFLQFYVALKGRTALFFLQNSISEFPVQDFWAVSECSRLM